MQGADRFFSNQKMKLLCRDDHCSVYQMKNETGDGTATCYQVYPGISVLYNDYHISSCPSRKFENEHIISTSTCMEGRIEWEVSDGAYLYLASGELCWIARDGKQRVQFPTFPLSRHYYYDFCSRSHR